MRPDAPHASSSAHEPNQRHQPIDLRERAERAARDAGFETAFSPQAQAEAARLDQAPLRADAAARDLSGLLWSSIDNEESRDLDQVEWCERGKDGAIRVLVGIADVASQVLAGSQIDAHAARNTTSIYTGIEVFPMLPERLSTDLTSLLPEQERLAIVIEMSVGTDGQVLACDIYRALVKNAAKLVYESIGDWLDGPGPAPPAVARVPALEAQIRLQWEVAQRLKARHQSEGALDVDLPEARPIVSNGRVTGLEVPRKNPARLIIENFMVTANMVLAQFLEEQKVPAIQRVVRQPERWPRIVQLARDHGAQLPAQPNSRALAAFMSAQKAQSPERFGDLSLAVLKLLGRGEYAVVHGASDSIGHFGLGMHNYAHSTAPNRRFPDLVTQRILGALLAKAQAPYAEAALEAIAARCTEREAAAQKVERLMRKVAAAALLSDRIGEVFQAVVTGASDKGTYIRSDAPPVEGRLMRGERGLDVGDKVRVRLTHADAERGFIDFERA